MEDQTRCPPISIHNFSERKPRLQSLGRKLVYRIRRLRRTHNKMHQAPHQRAGTNHGVIANGKTSNIVPNGTKNHGNNKNTVRGNDRNGKKICSICNISEANPAKTFTGNDFRAQAIAGSDSLPPYQQILQRAIFSYTRCFSADAPFLF